MAREGARDTAATAAPEEFGDVDERTVSLLRTFVRDDRLVSLPAQFGRRRAVLAYLTERTVNDALRAWCAEAEVDHVTIRRYLVDLCLLTREASVYWRP